MMLNKLDDLGHYNQHLQTDLSNFPSLSSVTWVVLLLKISSTSLSSLLYPALPSNIYRKLEYTWLIYSVKTPVIGYVLNTSRWPQLGLKILQRSRYRLYSIKRRGVFQVKGGFVLHVKVCYSTATQLQIYHTNRACFPVGNPPVIPNNSLFSH